MTKKQNSKIRYNALAELERAKTKLNIRTIMLSKIK